tara:strand:- start:385 stop:1131 length:747 start_codon:yes stop_codon:yes gene_type:complete
MALTKVTSGVRTLATSEVATANIAPGAVTGPKIAMGSDAAGDILFRGSSNYERLAKGTAGQKLQMNSGATAPEWVGYRAGEVIEEISLICNGMAQTVLSGSYTAPTVSAMQALTTTYADVTGSSFAYTPPTGTTRVLFTFHALLGYNDTNAITHWKLFLDSDEVTAFRRSAGASLAETYETFPWVFQIGGSADTAIGRVASWGSAKTIKFQAREYGSSNECDLHSPANFDGTGSSIVVPPMINIRAIA